MRDVHSMRTTLDIDADILLAAKEFAAMHQISMGKIISAWARKAALPQKAARTRRGVPLFPRSRQSTPVTMELINRLRDELS